MDEVEDDEREGAFVFQATRRELPADVRLQSVGNFVFLVHASMGNNISISEQQMRLIFR